MGERRIRIGIQWIPIAPSINDHIVNRRTIKEDSYIEDDLEEKDQGYT
mgnify:CR=1 FL=1